MPRSMYPHTLAHKQTQTHCILCEYGGGHGERLVEYHVDRHESSK
jgi:hypothetical protein